MYDAEKAQRMLVRLQSKAEKCAKARIVFETSFEKAKENKKIWKLMCKENGICEDSDIGDWMC